MTERNILPGESLGDHHTHVAAGFYTAIIIKVAAEELRPGLFNVVLLVQLSATGMIAEVSVAGRLADICRQLNVIPMKGKPMIEYLANKSCILRSEFGTFSFKELCSNA